VSVARANQGKRQIRLYVDLPYRDETWASFIDRAARFYRCDRSALVAQLTGIWPDEPWCNTDFDQDLPVDLYEALVDSLQVSKAELPNIGRGVSCDSLPPPRRQEYCPLCFLEDLRACRTPYFRFQWTIPLLTYCSMHRTPLVRWRSIRRQDERILPWQWLARPSSKNATACPWLQEDVAFVRQYRSSHVNSSHPFAMVRKLTESVLSIDVAARSWRLNGHLHHGFRLESLITLGASGDSALSDGLAGAVRPNGDDILFGPPREPITWEMRYMRRCWSSSAISVAFRRSLMWFAARTILGSRLPTLLANGATVAAGNWERWWLDVVKPQAGTVLSSKVQSEERHMRLCADNGQASLF